MGAEVGAPEKAELLPVGVCGVGASGKAPVEAVAATVDGEVVEASEGQAQHVVFVLLLDRDGLDGDLQP